ncbi:MAG: EutN/CcmL family microcompartment protein [Maledivibacter sp.]|jgi:ethanolamine utilization protein EutN|nr:EutN/CcmL family microcompartment protein [Maledivibacter sp.]
MILGKVKGNIISTRKHEKLVGFKLLIIEPYYGNKKDTFIAADRVGAGIGELVLVATDYAVKSGLEQEAPIDALVVGIVDSEPEKR